MSMHTMRDTTLALIELLGKAPEEFGVTSPTMTTTSSASMSPSSSSSGSNNSGQSSHYARESGTNSSEGSPTLVTGQSHCPVQPWEMDPCVSALSMVCPREGCAKHFNDYDEMMRHVRKSDSSKDGKCRA